MIDVVLYPFAGEYIEQDPDKLPVAFILYKGTTCRDFDNTFVEDLFDPEWQKEIDEAFAKDNEKDEGFKTEVKDLPNNPNIQTLVVKLNTPMEEDYKNSEQEKDRINLGIQKIDLKSVTSLRTYEVMDARGFYSSIRVLYKSNVEKYERLQKHKGVVVVLAVPG